MTAKTIEKLNTFSIIFIFVMLNNFKAHVRVRRIHFSEVTFHFTYKYIINYIEHVLKFVSSFNSNNSFQLRDVSLHVYQ